MPYHTEEVGIIGTRGEPYVEKIKAYDPSADITKLIYISLRANETIQGATIYFFSSTDQTNVARLVLNGKEILKESCGDNCIIEKNIDVIEVLKAGNNSLDLHLLNLKAPLYGTWYGIIVCVSVTVFYPTDAPIPDPYRLQRPPPDEGAPSPCLIMAIFGATSLVRFFPYLRIFRDALLPQIITNGYYAFSTWILRLVHLIA